MLNVLQHGIHGLNVPPEQLVCLNQVGSHSHPLSSLPTENEKHFWLATSRLCCGRCFDNRPILHESKGPMGQLLPAEREGVSDIRGEYVRVLMQKVAVLVNSCGQGPGSISREEEEFRPGNIRQRGHDVSLCESIDHNLDQLSTTYSRDKYVNTGRGLT